jgi:hypothetical protein
MLSRTATTFQRNDLINYIYIITDPVRRTISSSTDSDYDKL